MAINFDLNDLLAFRAVAELSSFRRAAESVHVSQPAFSRRIDKLEQALGVRLLDRTTRHVSLTAVGREFARKVEQMLDDLDNTLLGIRGVAATRMGEVTIACVPSTVYYFLSQVIRRCHESYPQGIYEAQHVTTLLGLVEAGLGVAAVPSLAMPGADHPLLVSVPLSDPVVTRRVGLIRRKGPSLSSAAQQLYDFLAEMKPKRKNASRS